MNSLDRWFGGQGTIDHGLSQVCEELKKREIEYTRDGAEISVKNEHMETLQALVRGAFPGLNLGPVIDVSEDESDPLNQP